MSVGNQFKRIGETAAAFGLWGIVLWFCSSPKIFFGTFLTVIVLFFSVAIWLDDRWEKHYVWAEKLHMYDKPHGVVKKTLVANDTLVLVDKLSNRWFKVLVGPDTLFFRDKYSFGLINTEPYAPRKVLKTKNRVK